MSRGCRYIWTRIKSNTGNVFSLIMLAACTKLSSHDFFPKKSSLAGEERARISPELLNELPASL
jgi:hypothetical protein